jgi:hypothetical protein
MISTEPKTSQPRAAVRTDHTSHADRARRPSPRLDRRGRTRPVGVCCSRANGLRVSQRVAAAGGPDPRLRRSLGRDRWTPSIVSGSSRRPARVRRSSCSTPAFRLKATDDRALRAVVLFDPDQDAVIGGAELTGSSQSLDFTLTHGAPGPGRGSIREDAVPAADPAGRCRRQHRQDRDIRPVAMIPRGDSRPSWAHFRLDPDGPISGRSTTVMVESCGIKSLRSGVPGRSCIIPACELGLWISLQP